MKTVFLTSVQNKPGLMVMVWAALCSLTMEARAITPLSDAAMANVAGQDGLVVDLGSSTDTTIDGVGVTIDPSTANEANLTLQNLTLSGVDGSGNVGGGYSFVNTFDSASDGSGTPYLQWTLNTQNTRLSIDALRLNRDPLNLSDTNPDPLSYGTLVIDGSAGLSYSNAKGLLNASDSSASLEGTITDGRIFYRQLWHEHPYLILNNLQALWRMNNANIGIVQGAGDDPFGIGPGLIQSADRIDLRLEADWEYKFPVGLSEDPFTITGNELPMLRFGWSGAFKDANLVWRLKGGWSGNNWNAATGGITFSSRWNYITNDEATTLGEPESEFRWVFGESGGGVQIELSDWTALGSNTFAHNFPLIAVDVINAGQGPGGLCYGGANSGPLSASLGCANGSVLNLSAGDIAAFREETYGGSGQAGGGTRVTNAPSLAALVRDGNLLAVSNQVKLVEAGSITRTFDWGLIYTLANVDGNIYLYPGGNPSDDALLGGGSNSLDNGFIVDLLLMSQTLDGSGIDQQGTNWNQGTHFMLADTAFEGSGVGIGFLDSNLLLAANDARFWIKPQWDSGNFYEGGIDILSPQTRLAFSGYFGGATLPAGNEIVRGAFIDLNMEGLLNLRLSPSDPSATIAADGGSNFLGYSAAFRLGSLDDPEFQVGTGGAISSGSGSYISIAEPSRTDVKVSFEGITGDIALVNGVIDLRGVGEEGVNSRPKLVVSNDILIGETAASRMTDAVIGHSLPGGPAGQPLIVNNVSFSGDSLGKIAVPSGQWGATLTFKPQAP